MSIGQNIRNKRENKGLTQLQLAEAVGIGRSYLCRIERGSSVLNVELAADIARELDCSIEDLVREAV